MRTTYELGHSTWSSTMPVSRSENTRRLYSSLNLHLTNSILHHSIDNIGQHLYSIISLRGIGVHAIIVHSTDYFVKWVITFVSLKVIDFN